MKENDWISLKESTPPPVTPVLVYGECCDACYNIIIAEHENLNWFESSTGEYLTFDPAFYMPLPQPPNKINQQ